MFVVTTSVVAQSVLAIAMTLKKRWEIQKMFVVTTSVVAQSVMAIAMTLSIGGVRTCLGTGAIACQGALLGLGPVTR
ncbi:hypothetical protein [Oscillatoria sp. HE19RPO]|uniref:hypothetical protein n=1 Tax=Oscillatoria sp. HE19RPO TaxID=2954806 RepID=UPI0020C3CD87|nr:hypothetical protein [Oscillatoria sp. HE19RPO]